jgi:hypothetical protein
MVDVLARACLCVCYVRLNALPYFARCYAALCSHRPNVVILGVTSSMSLRRTVGDC